MTPSTYELERRIAAHLARRMALQGQLSGLDDEQLAGIGKKLKKVAKKVGKVVKKVAPIALGAGALYLGAKAVSNLTASPSKKAAKAEKKAAKKAAKVAKQAAKLGLAVAPAAATLALQTAVQSGAVPSEPSAGAQLIDTAGKIATAVIAAESVPSIASDAGMQQIVRDAVAAQAGQGIQYATPASSYSGAPGVYSADASPQELEEFQVNGKPSMIIPALLAGLVGLAVISSRNKD